MAVNGSAASGCFVGAELVIDPIGTVFEPLEHRSILFPPYVMANAPSHGQIISGVGPFLKSRAIERHAYTHREQFPSRGDKAVRAQSMRGRMAMLGLYVRQGAPWFAECGPSC
jgi:hypothetical protein